MKKTLRRAMTLVLALIMVASVNTIAYAYSDTYSFSNAKKMSLNKSYAVDLPANTEKTYYKIVLSKKTKVKFNADYTHGFVYMYDPDLNVIVDDDEAEKKGDLYYLKKTMTLDKGTYYISFDSHSGYNENILHFKLTDKTKPDVPTISKVVKKNGVLSGKTIKNATVYAKIGNATYSGKANAKGAFSIKTTKLKAGTAIKIWAKSESGVKGAVLNYVVQ